MRASQASVSACIVTYRSSISDVAAAVKSLLACSIPINITVVDNDSGAGYRAELAKAFGGNDRIVIVDSGMNKGFGAGHNLGYMRSTRSDYHLLVNPDIVVHAGAIEALATYMEANPEIGLIAPRIVDEQGKLQLLCKRTPNVFVLFGRRFLPKSLQKLPVIHSVMQRYQMQDMDYEKPMEPEFVSGCFMMFRSSVFAKLRGFDERFFLYFEDCDITLRAREISKVLYFPSAVVTHAWRGGAKNNMKLTRIMIISAFKFFNKWGWRWI